MKKKDGRPAFAKWLALFGAVVVLPVVVWVGAHHIRPIEPPLFTTADMAAAPPPEQNAYHLLPLTGLPAPTDELTDLAARYDEQTAEETWALVDALDPALREPRQDVPAAIRDFQTRPRFVPDAPLLGDSNGLETIRVFRLIYLDLLLHASREDASPRFREATRMWEQALDYASNCIDLVSCRVGQMTLGLALAAADALSLRVSGPRSRGAARALAEVLASADLASLSMRQALIRDYLIGRAAIERSTGLLLDRAHTDGMFRQRIETELAYMEDPSGPPPHLASPRERPLWWLYDHDGKVALEMLLALDYGDFIETFAHDRSALIARREEVVAHLRSAAEAAATEEEEATGGQ